MDQPTSLRSVADRLNELQGVDQKELVFNQAAQDLVNGIFILMRSAGLYDLDNQALDQPYENLLKTVHKIYEIVRSFLALPQVADPYSN